MTDQFRYRMGLAVVVVTAGAIAGVARAGDLESRESWLRDGARYVEREAARQPIRGRARNIVLFIGDGMGITTVTASRILAGQLRGDPGEENKLSFEELPYTALVKTYNTNQQTPDSAGCMTAIVTGVKTKAGMLSLDQQAIPGNYESAKGHELPTLLELAERSGRATGVVTTTRVTHATPAACYAHTPERDWEDDAWLAADARAAGFPDIARQLLEFNVGDGLEVVLGGGRACFLPQNTADPEDAGKYGRRRDGRDLTQEWVRRGEAAYVWDKATFDRVGASTTRRLLGLFSQTHMCYEADRSRDKAGEPSLSEMTAKALDILSRDVDGFFLMVEGGRIDHAHHEANAYRALTDTIEFANAVRVVLERTSREDTLVVVTADHSHVFTMAGYPTRGNPILGKVIGNDADGMPSADFDRDALGLPYTTLGYANGPGYSGASLTQLEGCKHMEHNGTGYAGISAGRPDLAAVDTSAAWYLQECMLPMLDETHGGEDVPLYADGPYADLFRGAMEQNVVFHVICRAAELDREPR